MPVYSAWILFSIENSIMVFCTFNLFWITTGTYAKYVFRINAKKKDLFDEKNVFLIFY